jgi:hypothetical protein
MSGATESRKSYREIVWAIIEALPVQSVASVQDIATEIGSSWETTWRWLTLIKMIQEEPKIEIVKVGKSKNEFWRRKRKSS